MNDSDKNSFIQFLVSESRNKSRQNDCLQKTIDDLSDRLRIMQLTLDKIESSQDATHSENLQLTAQLSDQCACLKSMRSELQKALREAAKYRGLYEVLRNEKFVGTSQKSLKSRPEAGRDDDKDEWNGTGNAGVDDSISGSVTSSATGTECSSPTFSAGSTTDSLDAPIKDERPNRQGLKYNTMKAGAAMLHKCDLTRIPADATIIKTELRSSFHFISRIEEHQREYVTYRTHDGHLVICLAFGSHQGAETTTVYHTFTATCRMGALSFNQFLKKYFTAFMEGRTDFERVNARE